jgi:hypothetical protein
MIKLYRAAYHEAGHCVAALRFALPLLEVVIHPDGTGCTKYARRLGVGEVERWAVSAFAGIEAEVDRFGNAPIEEDQHAIARALAALGLDWGEPRLDGFRERARALVREERRAIGTVAAALLRRRHMSGDEVGVILSPSGRRRRCGSRDVSRWNVEAATSRPLRGHLVDRGEPAGNAPAAGAGRSAGRRPSDATAPAAWRCWRCALPRRGSAV